AQELTRIARHPYLSEAAAPPSPAPLGVGFSALDQILQMLLKNSGVDLGQYRQTTIRRRIARRMMVHGVDTLDNYRLYLEGHPSQLQALHNDLLVNVTRFFRDSEAFGILQRSVFPSIIERRQADAPIRFWAPGCATGEEAYSLAIGLLESLGETANLPIQVFGTDVSEPAIVKARAGIYPENIELDVPAVLLREAGWPVSSRQGGARALRLRQAQPGHGSALLEDGSHRVPQCAHLPRAGAAEARVVDLPLRPEDARLPDAGSVGDGRVPVGFLLGGRQEVQGLRQETDLDEVRPGREPSRSRDRDHGDGQGREDCGRDRRQSVGPDARGR